MVNAALAQLVEQGTENPCVLGSIPRRGTTLKTPVRVFFVSKSNLILRRRMVLPSRKTIHRIVLLGRVRHSTTSKATHRVAFLLFIEFMR